ncbi:MAG: hypothetical protein O7F12_01485 [Nitrospirae bacterium]|nr:hypothetical protein [Nitrospirota bacterium]
MMALFDEGFNFAVVILALLFVGFPFLALWIRNTQWPKLRHPATTKWKSSIPKSIITTGVLALSIMAAQPASAENFELYMISTGSEVELYQVSSTLKPVKLTGARKDGYLAFRHFPQLFLDSTHGYVQPRENLRMLTSGFQTTPLGRILKVAGRIDWQKATGQELVRSSPNIPTAEESLSSEKSLPQLTMSKVPGTTLEKNN